MLVVSNDGSLVLLGLLIRLVGLAMLNEVAGRRQDHLLCGRDPEIWDFRTLDLLTRSTGRPG